MPQAPSVVAFDVNETLASLESLRERFEERGAAGQLLETWFASTLRDGLALTAAGAYAEFQEVAEAALEAVLSSRNDLSRELNESVDYILAGLQELELHNDVADGMRRLHEAGVRMVTLTNGSAELTQTLLARGGVEDLVERSFSVADVRRWKPAPEPYLYAARECGLPVEEVALIAVHPWDVDGAKRAGLLAGWLQRKSEPYPDFFERPDATGSTLIELADALVEL